MGARAFNLVGDMEFSDGDCVVEIGAERGEGSSKYLQGFCEDRGIPFFSVDIKPTRLGTLRMDGETFLKYFLGNIQFAYLDNYDYIFPGTKDAPWIKDQEAVYGSMGYELNNKESEEAHLVQAKMISRMAKIGSRILIDDTYRKGDEITGKGATAVPYLLNSGYKLINEVGNTVESYALLEKVS